MTRPSFSDYGTYDESAYPELWEGVIGAWCPSLGPTGDRLHNLSRYNNWGTLTNIDPATDWVVSGGQYALDFDGVNDYAMIGAYDTLNSTTQYVSAWIRPTAVASDYTVYSMSNTAASVYRGLWVTAGSLRWAWGSTGGSYRWYTTAAATITANRWQHVAAGHIGTGAPSIWINGVSQTTTLTSAGVNSLPSVQQSDIGRLGNNFYFQGQIDDVVVRNRPVSDNEIRGLYLLGPAGMYERRRRTARRAAIEQAGFRAYWARRQNQIIGGGVR